MSAATKRRTKGTAIPPEVYRKLKTMVQRSEMKIEVAAYLKVHPNTLRRIIRLKRCSPNNLARIKRKIKTRTKKAA